jgi:predicted permease
VVKYRPVSDGYFSAIGMPILRGREFSASDREDVPWVVVINEAMARQYWGEEDPLGKRIHFGDPEWRTIVGIAGDVRHEGLDRELQAEMYVPYSQTPNTVGTASIVVRAEIDAAAMTATLRQTVAEIDAGLPLDQIRTMEQMVSASVGAPRFRTVLLGMFSMLALAMAAVGVFGVTSYSVVQRTREFGVYLAVGATERDVLKMVLGRAVGLIGVGVMLGLAGAFGVTRVIERFLFGVEALDWVTFVTVPVFLLGVGVLASYVPARRATRVDPMVALRYE